VEIKHQPESNLWHPKPLACGKLPHNTLQWKNLRVATASAAAASSSKPTCETFNRSIRWVLCTIWNFPIHLQYKPW
jgi:hypothetical protein